MPSLNCSFVNVDPLIFSASPLKKSILFCGRLDCSRPKSDLPLDGYRDARFAAARLGGDVLRRERFLVWEVVVSG